MNYVVTRSLTSVVYAIFLITQGGCAARGHLPPDEMAAQRCSPLAAYSGSVGGARSIGYRTSKGFGCADNVNFEHMIERPSDLEHGRTLDPADGERESLAVQGYEEGNVSSPKSAGNAAPTIIMPAAAAGGKQ